MCSEIVVRCSGLGKAYRRYDQPADRLKEFVLGRRYGEDFWALRDVDLEVRRGETLGIIGRNGSGKSTLLQLICGTLQASAGEVSVYGRVAALLELGAGFNPDFTGRENVELSASVLGLTREEIAERLPAIEAFAGIGDFIDLPVRQYSSGMYARLAFAVCAHVDADILVVDEILAVGDAGFQQKCMRFLNAFRARGTLLFVSHDEGTVLALCEQALWLDGGVPRALGPSKDVCRRYLAATAETAVEGGDFARGEGFERSQPAMPALPQDARWAGTNPIEVFDFDPEAPWHGHGGAVIEHAGFFVPGGAQLAWAQGGEEVELRIACRASRRLTQPIVGFILRNRLGLNLFGDNTYLTYRHSPLVVEPGEQFTATFCFQLPFLPSGDYAVVTAITEGTQEDHIHVHWIEQAIALRVTDSPIKRGELGVAMTEIRID
jgi:lipopolysaccharide transport system ATP-binding protein